jgi:hypothetical protein
MAFMYNGMEGYECTCPREDFSIPIRETIHPFPKHLRFSWLGSSIPASRARM